MNDFSNKLALVFGGGRDIGGAISIALAKRGAQVALSYNSSDPQETMAAIEATGWKPHGRRRNPASQSACWSTWLAACSRARRWTKWTTPSGTQSSASM